MALDDILQRILTEPAPEDLWALQPLLLAENTLEASQARQVAGQFYGYLVNIRSKLTSKQYSLLGAALAATSIGIMAMRDLLDSAANDPEHLLQNALAGGLASSAEGLSTVQAVRAWEAEFSSVHQEALWNLYGLLWQLAVDRRPDQPVEMRHALIEQLLAPARAQALSGIARTGYLIRLFQIALLLRLRPVIAARRQAEAPARDSV